LSQENFARECFLFVENGKEKAPSIVTRHLLERSAPGDPGPTAADLVTLELEGSRAFGVLFRLSVADLAI
jgi:hypothetical protein